MQKAYDILQKLPAASPGVAVHQFPPRLVHRARRWYRPICQDTGVVNVFMEIGMDVRWDATMSLQEMVNEGVRQAYLNKDNTLRFSMVSDPAGNA